MDRGPVVRRLGSAALFAALLTVGGLASGSSRADAAAPPCGAAPSGRISTGVAVDDDGSEITVRCVTLPEGATGFDALSAAGHRLRIEGGFLCAIDGVPATGCATTSHSDGYYWRYFHAVPGGAWTYSTAGAGYRMTHKDRCAIEGWRWSDSDNAATSPRVAVPHMNCVTPGQSSTPVPPTTSLAVAARPPAASPAPPRPTPSALGGSPAPDPTGGSGEGTGSPGPADPVPPAPGPADGELPGPVVSGDTGETTTSLPTTETPDSDVAAGHVESAEAESGRRSGSEAAGKTSRSGPADKSSVGGTVIAVVILVLIGGVGAIQARRRLRSRSNG